MVLKVKTFLIPIEGVFTEPLARHKTNIIENVLSGKNLYFLIKRELSINKSKPSSGSRGINSMKNFLPDEILNFFIECELLDNNSESSHKDRDFHLEITC